MIICFNENGCYEEKVLNSCIFAEKYINVWQKIKEDETISVYPAEYH